MDKGKEIEEMKHTVFMNVSYGVLGMGYWEKNEWFIDLILEILVNAGYGNVKQAVKEFATFMYSLVPIYCDGSNQLKFHKEIDHKFKELYGEDGNES